jgi:predicted glutamine amidotransferase
MCGIVGLVIKQKNGFTNTEINIFTELLYADEVRGSDGTGIFYNTKKNKAHLKVLKGPLCSSLFVKSKPYQEATKTFFSDSNFIVGHNRSATKGKIDFDCTHPFREQHITLVHNGTLVSQKELHETAEVDSHAICHSISQKGAVETLKTIDGAFALVWFDSKEKTLNLCRNYQRPLHVIETNTSFIFTSELELGLWVLKRNNTTVKTSFEIGVKKIYSFSLNDMSLVKEKEVEFKVPFFQQYDNNKWNQNQHYSQQQDGYRKKRNYAFGERIKFKTGPIEHTHGLEHNSAFLEGDIVKYNHFLDNVALLPSDYEDEWRIRTYGFEDILLPLACETKLIGTICKVLVHKEQTIYIVNNISKYGSNVLTLPLTNKNPQTLGNLPLDAADKYIQDKMAQFDENKEEGKKCEWCDKELPNETDENSFYGAVICKECVDQQIAYGC